MVNDHVCPICGAAETLGQIVKEQQTYKNHTCDVDMHLRACVTCGSEFAGIEESRLNKRAMIAFKKRVDGLLSGAKVREYRESFGLTVALAGKVFGGGPVAFSKYENDEICQSDAINKLLIGAKELPAFYVHLCKQVGVKVKVGSSGAVTVEATDSIVLEHPEDLDMSQYVYSPKLFRRVDDSKVKNA